MYAQADIGPAGKLPSREDGQVARTKTNTDPAVWAKVLALHGAVEQELGKALSRRHGLGLSEYRALSLLATAPDGELRIQELAEELGLNQSSVSRIVARLEEVGLTRRAICDTDRRGVYSVILP